MNEAELEPLPIGYLVPRGRVIRGTEACISSPSYISPVQNTPNGRT